MVLVFLFIGIDICVYRKMTGIEYMLTEVTEPHLFVIRKQKRDSPEKVTPMLTYYVLDGSIYQAPQLCNVFAARVVSIPLLILLYSHEWPSSFIYYLVISRIDTDQWFCKMFTWFVLHTLFPIFQHVGSQIKVDFNLKNMGKRKPRMFYGGLLH